jgi:hypothetical protein
MCQSVLLGKGISKIISVVVLFVAIFSSGLEENSLHAWTKPSLIAVLWECYDLSKQALWGWILNDNAVGARTLLNALELIQFAVPSDLF